MRHESLLAVAGAARWREAGRGVFSRTTCRRPRTRSHRWLVCGSQSWGPSGRGWGLQSTDRETKSHPPTRPQGVWWGLRPGQGRGELSAPCAPQSRARPTRAGRSCPAHTSSRRAPLRVTQPAAAVRGARGRDSGSVAPPRGPSPRTARRPSRAPSRVGEERAPPPPENPRRVGAVTRWRGHTQGGARGAGGRDRGDPPAPRSLCLSWERAQPAVPEGPQDSARETNVWGRGSHRQSSPFPSVMPGARGPEPEAEGPEGPKRLLCFVKTCCRQPPLPWKPAMT